MPEDIVEIAGDEVRRQIAGGDCEPIAFDERRRQKTRLNRPRHFELLLRIFAFFQLLNALTEPVTQPVIGLCKRSHEDGDCDCNQQQPAHASGDQRKGHFPGFDKHEKRVGDLPTDDAAENADADPRRWNP